MLRRAILMAMRLRALALFVAASIATAPSFVVACRVACATAEDAESPVEHGCHHDAAPTESTGLVAVHGCGHDDAELATSGEKPSPFAMAFVAIAVFVAEPISSLAPPVAPAGLSRARPPDRSLRSTQLRI